MLHNVLILKDSKNRLGAHIIIDGKEIAARSYNLKQDLDEIPILSLDIPCFTLVNRDYCKIEFGMLDDLARIMDEKELNSFISMWQKYHSEGE